MATRTILVVDDEPGVRESFHLILDDDYEVIGSIADQPLRLLHLVLSSDARNDAITGIPEAELAARRIPAQTFVLGPEAERFERDYAMYTGVQHCVGVGNGTDAIALALENNLDIEVARYGQRIAEAELGELQHDGRSY